jgi:hypothetical protein
MPSYGRQHLSGWWFIDSQTEVHVKTADLGLDEVKYDSITFKICMAELTTYHISVSHLQEHGALVDCGTNGGIAGADCCIIKMADQAEGYINIEGIGDHII